MVFSEPPKDAANPLQESPAEY
ncbi:hypothetical protein PIIN_11191 [Serendipita indica DSM 11827]|uniref:Uncharacterized protein n=1 Tax=Serendipita indica (strain DSM 11827) TaxID=1109443 RepID=G4U0W6_SERID|nr:hypothetical protein PIIN_11191 [Serendipita indica DSM 11827]